MFLDNGSFPTHMEILQLVWKAKIPVKVQVFIWRAVNEAIPTRDQLVKRGVLSSTSMLLCEQCGQQLEDIDHVFLKCSFAYDVWRNVCGWWGVRIVCGPSWKNLFFPCQARIRRKKARAWCIIFAATVWALWLRRNALIFRKEEQSVERLFRLIRVTSFEWVRYRCKWGGFSFAQWDCNPCFCLC
ncbi:hypothetical protein Ancab_040201 [Ancistrocladus abbreviatus]